MDEQDYLHRGDDGVLHGAWKFMAFPLPLPPMGRHALLYTLPFSLFVVGIPISLLEITLGQKFQLGDVGVFRAIHPKLTGIGYASIMASYSLVVYYNVMIAWSLIFLIT